jgi:hypothetical protein
MYKPPADTETDQQRYHPFAAGQTAPSENRKGHDAQSRRNRSLKDDPEEPSQRDTRQTTQDRRCRADCDCIKRIPRAYHESAFAQSGTCLTKPSPIIQSFSNALLYSWCEVLIDMGDRPLTTHQRQRPLLRVPVDSFPWFTKTCTDSVSVSMVSLTSLSSWATRLPRWGVALGYSQSMLVPDHRAGRTLISSVQLLLQSTLRQIRVQLTA